MTDPLLNPLLGEFAFRGSLSAWVAYPLIVLSVVAVFAVYFRESMNLRPAQRIAMALLRGLAIACIILLLRKPVFISQLASEKQLPIALLIDNTQSMSQRDPRVAEEDRIRAGIAYNTFPADYGLKLKGDDSYGRLPDAEPTRAEVVMAAFQNPSLNLRERLREKGPLAESLFGQQLRGAAKDWEKNLPASETQTSILGSIGELLQHDDNDLPAAIVLVTDGRENVNKVPWDDVGRECVRLKIPVFVYGVGGGSQGLLQLKDVALKNDTLSVEDPVDVPFRWRCMGIREGEIELNVTLGGRVVVTKRIKVKEGDDLSETLTFKPEKRDVAAGKQELVASIKIVGGRDEDKLAKMIRFVDTKVKLLYVETSPRWEFKFIMRSLEREKIVEPTFIVVNGDKKTLESGPPFLPAFPATRKDLAAYDLLVIGDVDANYFSTEQRGWIKDFVAEGGGLVMIAGRQYAPASYLGKSVGDILPVEFEAKPFPIDDNRRPIEYLPKLSEVGSRESVMRLADTSEDNQRVWANLPGWYWNYPVTKLKPAAVSLLDHPKLEIEDSSPLAKDKKRPMPLIARHYYGRGLVMFVATDETWRWRYNEADKYFGRFWGQIVYQMGLPHLLGSKSQLIQDGDAIVGKETKIYARLFTPDSSPLKLEGDRKHVAATVEQLDSKTVEDRPETVFFEPVEGQPGMFAATISKNRAGNYRIKLTDNVGDGATLDVPYRLASDDERAPGNLNLSDLRRLAEQTGGKFYREETLRDLPNDLQGKTVKLDPPPHVETLIWTRWWALLTVVGLLTAEWLIRKFSNLS